MDILDFNSFQTLVNKNINIPSNKKLQSTANDNTIDLNLSFIPNESNRTSNKNIFTLQQTFDQNNHKDTETAEFSSKFDDFDSLQPKSSTLKPLNFGSFADIPLPPKRKQNGRKLSKSEQRKVTSLKPKSSTLKPVNFGSFAEISLPSKRKQNGRKVSKSEQRNFDSLKPKSSTLKPVNFGSFAEIPLPSKRKQNGRKLSKSEQRNFDSLTPIDFGSFAETPLTQTRNQNGRKKSKSGQRNFGSFRSSSTRQKVGRNLSGIGKKHFKIQIWNTITVFIYSIKIYNYQDFY